MISAMRIVQLDPKGKEALDKEFKDLIRGGKGGGGNPTPAPVSVPSVPVQASANRK